MAKFLLTIILLISLAARAAPMAEPGDTLLRHDLQLLNDAGIIEVPLSAWPLTYADINDALKSFDGRLLSAARLDALDRVRHRIRSRLSPGSTVVKYDISGVVEPRFIRAFENTPREEGEIGASFSWIGHRLTIQLSASVSANPFDGDDLRPDGTYAGVVLGNWILTAGWQERWWGPSRDGSLILSTNARPMPGIAVQRNISTPFETKWLSWMGNWTFAGFMTRFDDERVVNDALLFGVRGTIRPPNTGLEIGVSRAAQWCGDDRPCSLSTFGDLLLGNDNGGVNVDSAAEPGNQLGGLDVRWRLPKDVPIALYMQWIGEDGRGGGGAIGSWTRQLGAEHWGTVGDMLHRSHMEVSDSMCREGGFGFSSEKPNCAYDHFIYRTGFRYKGKSLGHSIDGDGRSYSFGSTLVQSAGHSWNFSLRYMELNRVADPSPGHSLSSIPKDVWDVQFSHQRETEFGRFYFGLGLNKIGATQSEVSRSNISAFLRWSSQ